MRECVRGESDWRENLRIAKKLYNIPNVIFINEFFLIEIEIYINN